MQNIFYGRSYLAEKNFSGEELYTLIKLAEHLKFLKQQRVPHEYLKGRNIALLFEKTSTRTRSSFTVAATDLGAHAEFLGAKDIQFGKKESLSDTARVLGSMYDAIEYRGYSQPVVETLAAESHVPVWNGLTDDWHPTQMLADFMTMDEVFGHLKGLKLAYLGDTRNNVANSLLVTGALLGVDITLVAPESLQPTTEVQQIARKFAEKSGAKIVLTDDVALGVQGAHVLYTDVWASMGEEDAWAERIQLLQRYQINAEVVAQTGRADTIVLHDLPAFHDLETTMAQDIYKRFGLTEMEITNEVFHADNAKQFQQAENRLHTIKAVMAATLGELFLPQPLAID